MDLLNAKQYIDIITCRLVRVKVKGPHSYIVVGCVCMTSQADIRNDEVISRIIG